MVTENQLLVYDQDCVRLAKTIIIKNTYVANIINNYVDAVYGPDKIDYTQPHTWKYYLNLSGVYHYTDVMMTITSTDTLEEIEFTKENLSEHVATASAYRFGTRLYYNLVEKYPNQELLILGILYPVDIDKAVQSDNYTILGYPSDLVEQYEYSFIERLQSYVTGYFERWFNPQYILVDDYYLHAFLAVFYLNLIPTIQNLRLEACKTNEAHSFHIKQYFASHGYLDRYYKYLTRKQVLFLYRNINYIERYAGRKSTFTLLVDNLLTERRLPIGEYVMRQITDKMPAELLPYSRFDKNNINPITPAKLDLNVTTREMLKKEEPEAIGNSIYREDNILEIDDKNTWSPSNTELTKVLESSVVDTSEMSAYTLEHILINNWANLANTNKYVAYSEIEYPMLEEKLTLSAKDSFILFIYCLYKGYQVPVDIIPPFMACRVQRVPMVSKSELMGLIKKTYIDTKLIDFIYPRQPIITKIISIKKFFMTCKAIHECMQIQNKITFLQENNYHRGLMQIVMSRFYSDNPCYFYGKDNPILYTDWLRGRGINLDAFTPDNFKELAETILGTATGLTEYGDISIRRIQAAMIAIMKQLSSYSVQFVKEVAYEKTLEIDSPMVRPASIKSRSDSIFYIDNYLVDLTRFDSKGTKKIEYKMISTEDWDIKINFKGFHKAQAKVIVDLNLKTNNNYKRYADPCVGVVVKNTGLDPKTILSPELYEQYMAIDSHCQRKYLLDHPNVIDPNTNNKPDGLYR